MPIEIVKGVRPRSKKLSYNEKELIRELAKTCTISEIIKEVAVSYAGCCSFLTRHRIKPVYENDRKQWGIRTRNCNWIKKYKSVSELISLIDSMELLKGGWRQIQNVTDKHYQNLLIDELFAKRDELLLIQNN